MLSPIGEIRSPEGLRLNIFIIHPGVLSNMYNRIETAPYANHAIVISFWFHNLSGFWFTRTIIPVDTNHWAVRLNQLRVHYQVSLSKFSERQKMTFRKVSTPELRRADREQTVGASCTRAREQAVTGPS